MDHSDEQVGSILTRREVVASLGVAGAAFFTTSRQLGRLIADPAVHGISVAGCVVRPAQEEGPYFVDERLNRSDIRSDPASGLVSPGVPLQLTVGLSHVGPGGCVPAAGVLVDIWHCDASGAYSDEMDGQGRFDTRGKKFLRGYQVTDGKGVATFRTIYPGWYEGRAVHIHVKLRTAPGAKSGNQFTSQMYFEDAMNERVHAGLPYSTKGKGRMPNAEDGIFQNGGKQLTLALTPEGTGYATRFDIGMAS